ncbi:helix-turn-helix domain-containing protein [Aureimonas phyllosphaerae]|uniref:helix-turn-helix domain-containing protein n=1 Tax=Aureimonas phyllosphaerae TaxID=1166078 RepID=UPI003A5C4764
MNNKLKQLRAEAGLTQSMVAAAVGVSQPNYQRWETGAAPIPGDKLDKLAEALGTDPATILGRHAPVRVGLYDDSVEKALSYYGEVAVHFAGGGEPLLLSISEDAFERLHADVQRDTPFLIVRSLCNETVAIRSKAIADLYFSSEAYDDYGPETERYGRFTGQQMADPRDWQIVAALAGDEVGAEDFAEEDVERVRGWLMVTDEQFEKLVADRRIEPDELEAERARMRDLTDRLFALATQTVWQFSTGRRRSEEVYDERVLYEAFYPLTDFGGDLPGDEMLRLPTAGSHRIIFINPHALDYVSIPTHSFEEGRLLETADELDERDAAEARRPANPRLSARRGRTRR